MVRPYGPPCLPRPRPAGPLGPEIEPALFAPSPAPKGLEGPEKEPFSFVLILPGSPPFVPAHSGRPPDLSSRASIASDASSAEEKGEIVLVNIKTPQVMCARQWLYHTFNLGNCRRSLFQPGCFSHFIINDFFNLCTLFFCALSGSTSRWGSTTSCARLARWSTMTCLGSTTTSRTRIALLRLLPLPGRPRGGSMRSADKEDCKCRRETHDGKGDAGGLYVQSVRAK